ncbi:hypothetical protein L6164_005596 [Bauhinia variegata]|uniref:Uncharacterized protein n=1 Tax=Bauhinia variegata TaxID=167791 RepID=A0ACB9PRS3_BAUVA|nr:hypothetical protein L6164_005596 [Bauhinia variegata]
MNVNTSYNSSTVEDHDSTNELTYGIVSMIGMFFLVTIICCACIRLRNSSANPNMFNFLSGIYSSGVAQGAAAHTERGLDDNTLDSYPKLLYSEVQKGNLVSLCCSICLGDYKDTETLRLLPDCGHVFHLSCVDPWLKLHPTCPICRSSSVQTLQSSTSAQETLGHVV